MNDITVLPLPLTRLLKSDLTRLDPSRLREIDKDLNERAAELANARAKVHAALIQRYGTRLHEALQTTGRDFGTAHLVDGPVRIKGELPKRVQWDQKRLKEIAERIAAAGDHVEDYIEAKLAVPESRYANWPPALQQQFAAARTVVPGKPTFTLSTDEEQ